MSRQFLTELTFAGNVLSVDYPDEYQAYLKAKQAVFNAVNRDYGPEARASLDRNSYGVPVNAKPQQRKIINANTIPVAGKAPAAGTGTLSKAMVATIAAAVAAHMTATTGKPNGKAKGNGRAARR